MAAWDRYKFDRMFVGDDWKGDNMFQELERKFSEKGIQIVYFPYTKGTSSTYLREVLDKFNKK